MRIAVIGAGAIGCLYGAYLSVNHDVIMITHTEESARSIRENGIILTDFDGTTRTYTNIRAHASGRFSEPVDLVMLVTKSTQTDDALQDNAELIQHAALAMTLQNGGGNFDKIAAYLDRYRILLAITRNNCINLGNGKIRRTNDLETIIGTTEQNDAAVELVRSILAEAGLKATVSGDIRRAVWNKLFLNLSSNTFTAITNSPVGAMVETEYARRFAEKLMTEAVEVANTRGMDFVAHEVIDAVLEQCAKSPKGQTSMCQDIQNRRLTEIDGINGYIVEEAKRLGMDAPYNAFVVDIIHALEAVYKYR